MRTCSRQRRPSGCSSVHNQASPFGLGANFVPISCHMLRKEKALRFGPRISKLSDLSSWLLATCLARLLPFLTENSVMKMGGELLEAVC